MPKLLPGHGLLELTQVRERTEITHSHATNPLKLITPRRHGSAAWVYTSTFGGGLVAGDQIHLDMRLTSNTTCVLSTQASTKIYRDPSRIGCRQSLQAQIDDGALLISVPDPVTCFAESMYDQHLRYDLAPEGSVVLLDWLTSGRRTRGESWDFTRYRSQIDVYQGQRQLISDRLLLDPKDGPLESPFRVGRFHCLAVVVLVGTALEAAATQILEEVGNAPVEPAASLLETASPVAGGLILRIAGITTELVADCITRRLCFLQEFLGETPWARKW
ncbi:MAG: urease accessory protein UreD [Pirellulaceae bacterium]|nr:urease accessory protein UreD [Pirellulaceae bacterium]